jgi:hypothetical protein
MSMHPQQRHQQQPRQGPSSQWLHKHMQHTDR